MFMVDKYHLYSKGKKEAEVGLLAKSSVDLLKTWLPEAILYNHRVQTTQYKTSEIWNSKTK